MGINLPLICKYVSFGIKCKATIFQLTNGCAPRLTPIIVRNGSSDQNSNIRLVYCVSL